MMRAFDAPSREECTSARAVSNTPTAALTLLNDPTFVEAARGLAERILREGGASDEERLAYAFLLAVCRAPDADERRMLGAFLEEQRALYEKEPALAQALLRQNGHAPVADDLDRVGWAAWTAVARALLNMDETITRN
jgi:FPC/CPF motif-containing protein YcgG